MSTPLFSIAAIAVVILLLAVVGLLGAEAERKSRAARRKARSENIRLAEAVASWRNVVVLRSKPVGSVVGVKTLRGSILHEKSNHLVVSEQESGEAKRKIVQGIQRAPHAPN